MAWNQSNGAAVKPTPKKPSAMRGVIAGVAVVAAAVAVFFAMSGKDEKPKAKVEKQAELIKETKPAKATKWTAKPVAKQVEKTEKISTEIAWDDYEHRFPNEKIEKVTTNASGYVMVDTVATNGQKCRHVVSRPPIFECATDEFIMIALNTPEGQEIPPFPDMGGKRATAEFLKSLSKPIVDKDTDSDEIRACKEIVRSAREEIKERIDAGAEFADIIQQHRELVNENGKIRLKALKELVDIVKSGDMDGAVKYRDGLNDAFSKMGISPIEIPEKFRNQNGETTR